MKFSTIIKAVHPKTGEIEEFGGPVVDAICWGAAEIWCEENMPYARIDGRLDSIIENGVTKQFIFWN